MRYNGAGCPVRVPPFLDEVVDEDLSHAPGGPSWFGIFLWDLEEEGRDQARREWWCCATQTRDETWSDDVWSQGGEFGHTLSSSWTEES